MKTATATFSQRLLCVLLILVLCIPFLPTPKAGADDLDPLATYWYPWHGTSMTPFSVSDGSTIIGTFCVALHLGFRGVYSFNRVDNPGDNEDEITKLIGIDAQTLAEIRHAIAEMRTLYIDAGTLSLEQVQRNTLPDTIAAKRSVGPPLTQNLIWYRQYLYNPDFFKNPLPEPGYVPFTSAEQNYYYDGGLTFGDRIDIVLVGPADNTPNEHGYIGPYSIEYQAVSGNAATLIAINNNGIDNDILPLFSPGAQGLATYSAMQDGSGSSLQSIPMYTEFWVKPLLPGGSSVKLYPKQDIILGIQYESIFYIEDIQTQYNLVFDYFEDLDVYVGDREAGLSKTVSLFDDTILGEQSKYLELDENDKALFSMSVTNNSDLWPVDYLFVDTGWPDTGTVRRIYTAAQLANITAEEDIEWRVMNNIDLRSYCEAFDWPTLTLGEGSTINGQGFTISGLDIRRHVSVITPDVNSMSLIAVNNGTIENLVITDFSIVGASNDAFTTLSGNTIGAVAARNYGTIQDLYVSDIYINGLSYFGGIVGRNYGEITNIIMEDITIGLGHTGSGTNMMPSGDTVGGVAGWSQGEISNVTLNGVQFVYNGMQGSTTVLNLGGMIGYNDGTMENLLLDGFMFDNSTLPRFSALGVGGIAGRNYTAGVIREAFVTDIYFNPGNNVVQVDFGGVAGWNGGLICNASVEITSITAVKVGGIADTNSNNGVVRDVYVTKHPSSTGATITVSGSAGGIIDGNTGSLTNALVEDLTIHALGSGDFVIGGISASQYNNTAGTEFHDNEVRNLTVILEVLQVPTTGSTGFLIGGIVGQNGSQSALYNLNVDGFTFIERLPQRTTVQVSHIDDTGSRLGILELGGVLGRNAASTTISECSVDGFTAKVETYGYQPIIGGILGFCGGSISSGYRVTISNCQVTDTHLLGSGMVGGILGSTTWRASSSAYMRIENCSVTSTTLQSNIYANTSAVNANQCEVRSYVELATTSSVPTSIGGIAGHVYGQNFDSYIDQCYADVTIIQNVPSRTTGGIVGMVGSNAVAVTNCYSTGSITQAVLPRIAQGIPGATEYTSYTWGIGGMGGTESATSNPPTRNNISTMTINATTEVVAGIGGGHNTYVIEDIASCITANPVIHTSNTRFFGTTNDYFRRVSTNPSITAGATATRNYLRHLDTMVFTRGTGATPPLDNQMTLTGRDGLATSIADLQSADPGVYEEIYFGWDFDDVWNAPTGTAYPTLQNTGITGAVGIIGSVGYTDIDALGAGTDTIPIITAHDDDGAIWAYGARTRYVKDVYYTNGDVVGRQLCTCELLEFNGTAFVPLHDHDTSHADGADKVRLVVLDAGVEDPADSGEFIYQSFHFYYITDTLEAGNYRNELILIDEDRDEAEVIVKEEGDNDTFFVDVVKFAEDPRFLLGGAEFTLYEYADPGWSGALSVVTTITPNTGTPFELTSPGYYALYESVVPANHSSDGVYYNFCFTGNTITLDPAQILGTGNFEWQIGEDSYTLILSCGNVPDEFKPRGVGFTLGGTKVVAELDALLAELGIDGFEEITFTFELTQIDRTGNFLKDGNGIPIPRDSPAIISRDATVTATDPGSYGFLFDEIEGLLAGEYYFLIVEGVCYKTSDGTADARWILDETRYFIRVTVDEVTEQDAISFVVSSIKQADLDKLIWGDDDWINFDDIAIDYDAIEHASVLFTNTYNEVPDPFRETPATGDKTPVYLIVVIITAMLAGGAIIWVGVRKRQGKGRAKIS
ncbi:MAG: hypothetical protein FWD43_00690 [Coriobacteriia bacterium]|nr:hypothetical protein [Coriobacteriia bacterium]